MKKAWNSPTLECLDINLTMRGGGGGGKCGHKGHKGPKKDCPTPEAPPETPVGDS